MVILTLSGGPSTCIHYGLPFVANSVLSPKNVGRILHHANESWVSGWY
jgi:hypothetical protein